MNSSASTIGQGRHPVLVLGMGVTGASVARYLAARGESAWFADTRAAPGGLAAIRAAMPAAGLLNGAIPATLPPGVSRLVLSPGVDLDLPVIAEARERGLPLQSDLDLFVGEARAPLIGITGSNGKSTVTSMVGAMLAAAGWRTAVGGNLGTPALDLLDPATRAYVLELSSFHLERSALLPLAAAVVLNVAPDHLDKHGDMARYAAAKARIYAACDKAIVNLDEPELERMVPAGRPVIGFGLRLPGAGQFGVAQRDGEEWLAFGAQPLLPVAQLGTTGRHNVSNALAALALVQALGADLQAAAQALRQFRGLPHRMQVVPSRDGLIWIDDSKATNVAAAVTSIRGVRDPLMLIAGGDGKGQSFAELAEALRGRDARVYLLGRDREQMAAELAAVARVSLVDSLPQAVRMARAEARPGTTVLLAPACSSLDMFRSYEERGRVFAAAVQEQAA